MRNDYGRYVIVPGATPKNTPIKIVKDPNEGFGLVMGERYDNKNLVRFDINDVVYIDPIKDPQYFL